MCVPVSALVVVLLTAVSASPREARIAASPALPVQTSPASPSDSQDPAALTALAGQRAAQGEDDEAIRLLERALSISPNQPAANLALGQLLLRRDRLPEAMDRFETVLSVSRDNEARQGELAASTRLALRAKRAGNIEAAYRCLKHASQFLPTSAELLTDLGLVAEQLGRLDPARDALQRALALDPKRPDALYAVARVELRADHLAASEKAFRDYLSLKPDDATAWYGLGRDLHRQQRDPEAEQALRRSITIQPVQTESYYELGAIALDAQRDAEAKELFEKTLSRDPRHGGALTGMGEISYRARDFAAARKELTAAVVNSPDYQPAHYYLGLTLARLGEKDASAAELARATELGREQQGRGKPVDAGQSPLTASPPQP